MELSYNDKKEIRKGVEEQLKRVPEGHRIQLDNETLEFLLFETMTVNKKEEIKIKVPVWSGEFLRKIDLSQVDFTNVSWTSLDYIDPLFENENCYYSVNIDPEFTEEIERIIADKKEEEIQKKLQFLVDYSGTNAKIDLAKSFEAFYEYDKIVTLFECNFSGVDLSQNDLSKISSITLDESDISNTKLAIPNKIYLHGYQSNLEGINLSNFCIDGTECIKYINEGASWENLSGCNLRNTGINVELDEEKIQDYEVSQEEIEEFIEKYWQGCHIVTRKITASDMLDSITASIDEQIGSIKK